MNNVAIVDDHEFFTHSLSLFLRHYGYNVTGIFFDYYSAYEFFKIDTITNFAIIDVHLREKSGCEIMRVAKATNPFIKTIAISSFFDGDKCVSLNCADVFMDKGNIADFLLQELL